MELIPHHSNIDFVGKRKFFVIFSTVLNISILVLAAVIGLNWGVDFAGGSELEVKFDKDISATDVRKTVEEAGFEATVQTFGNPAEHTFLIRMGRVSLLKQADAEKANAALKAKYGDDLASFDFNEEFGDQVALRFKSPKDIEQLKPVLNEAGLKVSEVRPAGPNTFTVITSGIQDKVKAALDSEAAKGQAKAEIRRVESVGPQVGKQLRNRGILSVLYASIAILIYVAFRFDTRFAPGAVLGMIHDIIVVFGYFVVSRREFNLTSVAVLLTIVGYSVNDTIVVYDRIRETMGKMKGKDLASVINIALNETLARTILTSFATALSLVGLLIFGVGQIFDFAAAMLVGIITGTYSSIYIASPVTIWLEEITGKRNGVPPSATPARVEAAASGRK